MIKKNKILISCLLVTLLSSFGVINQVMCKTSVFSFANNTAFNGVFNLDKVIIEGDEGQGFISEYLVSAFFPQDTLILQTSHLKIDSLNLDTSFVDTANCNPILFRNYAGTIQLNSTAVNYINNSNFYIDTTFNLNSSSSFNWNISGSDKVDAFTFVNSNIFPSFTYTNNTFPSVIDTSSDIEITLSNISNADSVFITLCRTDSVTKGPFVIKHFAANTSSTFVIEKYNFSQYYSGQALYLQIALSNYKIKTLSNRNYLFVNNFDYKKRVYMP